MSRIENLSLETIRAILDFKLEDQAVNALVLQALGFQYDEVSQTWDATYADPEWQADTIPDVIANRKDSVKLTRSIPPEDKQLLKEQLQFPGYTIKELTPQKTRRATAANFLLGVLKRRQLKTS